jgi:hypothetical protein
MTTLYIEWEDSSVLPGIWNSASDLANETNHVCTSVGFLVHSDKDCVVVASHKGPHDDYAGAMRIPRRNILLMTKVEVPRG